MAEQKNTQPRQRGPQQSGGDKKSGKKGGGQKSSGFRASEAERRARKAASVRRHLAAQKKRWIRANRRDRTPHGEARKLRRARVALVTGATHNLA